MSCAARTLAGPDGCHRRTTYTGAGQWSPSLGVEYHGQSGATSYEFSLSRTSQVWDDSPGNGYRVVTPPGGMPVYDRAVRTGIMRMGYQLHGGLIVPVWGGDWDNNFTLQTNDYPSGIRYYGGGGSRFDSITRLKNGEFGSHWQGQLGAVNLESLVLQRLGHEEDSNTSAAPGGSAIFLARNERVKASPAPRRVTACRQRSAWKRAAKVPTISSTASPASPPTAPLSRCPTPMPRWMNAAARLSPAPPGK